MAALTPCATSRRPQSLKKKDNGKYFSKLLFIHLTKLNVLCRYSNYNNSATTDNKHCTATLHESDSNIRGLGTVNNNIRCLTTASDNNASCGMNVNAFSLSSHALAVQ
ncbi:hypothetical protein E2C01_089412 [Portunus trituberculatus]|uniref:Uncharacterized protein n=1 Tax=Portunus trituberculatus TaxID=210409 RepID=A0A5B7JBW8_PORTR|nr:hypothetical protein [Portunus trituberculatus]